MPQASILSWVMSSNWSELSQYSAILRGAIHGD